MSWSSVEIGSVNVTLDVNKITGKGRPRHTSDGQTYTPPKTHIAEEEIKWLYLKEVGRKWADWQGEVHLYVTSWRCLSKSNPKYWEGRADIGKPDGDNVLKLVIDALNGIAYKDDCQITDMRITKMPRLPFVAGNHIQIKVRYLTEDYSKEPK